MIVNEPMQLIPDFDRIVAEHRRHVNQMLIEVKTSNFQEHEVRSVKRHKQLYQGSYISVQKWRTYVTQVINLSAKQVFWTTREEKVKGYAIALKEE
jgi:hypothetical protein